LALANLDAHISGGEAAVARAPALERVMSLVFDLLTRAQFQGKLADYEKAATLAEAAVQRAPQDGRVYALRAKVSASYHRFDAARADLDRAERLGVPVASLLRDRASILQALGQSGEALALRRALTQEKTDLTSLGNEASVLADMGEVARADALFIEAQQHYPDVAPFPVAWLYFQHGSMWEKAGKPTRARALFQAAVERVPGYAHAASHLASLSSGDAAVALLTPIVRTSGDPEYAAQLGVLLREAGQRDAGEGLIVGARQGYERLTTAHPEAFADHAARFWLGAGADAVKALRWARVNFEVRPTFEALTLLVDATLTAPVGRSATCALAERVEVFGSRPAAHALAARALDACGRPEDASRQRALASGLP